jgi:hypothetical protein
MEKMLKKTEVFTGMVYPRTWIGSVVSRRANTAGGRSLRVSFSTACRYGICATSGSPTSRFLPTTASSSSRSFARQAGWFSSSASIHSTVVAVVSDPAVKMSYAR